MSSLKNIVNNSSLAKNLAWSFFLLASAYQVQAFAAPIAVSLDPAEASSAHQINELYRKSVYPIFAAKCLACHDSSRSAPAYGNILRNYNPVTKDMHDAQAAVDIGASFPFSSRSHLPQATLLAEIQAVGDKNVMPPRIYSVVHSATLSTADKSTIRTWVSASLDLIQKAKISLGFPVEAQSSKSSATLNIPTSAKTYLSQTCLKCH